jgi:hypothetical protein
MLTKTDVRFPGLWSAAGSQIAVAERVGFAIATQGELAIADDHRADEDPNERKATAEHRGNQRKRHDPLPTQDEHDPYARVSCATCRHSMPVSRIGRAAGPA